MTSGSFSGLRNSLNGLTQRVEINSLKCRPVASSVPQGSVLGLAHFNIFIGKMCSGILSKFVDGAELCNAVRMLEGRDDIQKDLSGLESWTDGKLMKFDKADTQEQVAQRSYGCLLPSSAQAQGRGDCEQEGWK